MIMTVPNQTQLLIPKLMIMRPSRWLALRQLALKMILEGLPAIQHWQKLDLAHRLMRKVI